MRPLGQFQNFLLFLRKDFASTKSTKSTRRTKSTKNHKNANKRVINFLPLRCFLYALKRCLLVLLACIRFVLVVRVKSFRKKNKKV